MRTRRYSLIRNLLKVVLAALLPSGCSMPLLWRVPPASGATPEEAALRLIPNLSRPAPAEIRVLATYPVRGGAVVFYIKRQQGSGGPPAPLDMGYVLAEQRGTTWHAIESSSGVSLLSQPGELLVYNSGTLRGGQAWLVYGRVVGPNVAAVEATFDQGQTVRSDVRDGMFAIVAPGAKAACEVRALDAQGTVLQPSDPSKQSNAPPGAQQRVQRCRR